MKKLPRLIAQMLVGSTCMLAVVPAYSGYIEPLLMPGKKSLFQRVLTTPNSRIIETPGAESSGKAATPFMIYYVYERQTPAPNDEWLKVGSDAHGTILGWVKASEVIPWNQALTVSFKDPRRQDRVMLFRDRETLRRIVEKQDFDTYGKLYSQAVKGEETDESTPVVAVQPAAPIDIQKNFYLIPIKSHEDVFIGSAKARLLEVASVAANSNGKPKGAASPATNPPERPQSFKSGIAFVIDTTQSMRPYIDKTREVVRKVYEAINTAGVKDKVSFGLTAFRDDLNTAPQSEYLTRDFVTLDKGFDEQQFFKLVDGVTAAEVSNKGFPEDAYAGVKAALENNDWSPYSGRIVILITDASSRFGADPLSSTHYNAKDLQKLAQEKGVAILVMHLRTPRGKADHEVAKKQYKELSNYPDIGDLYYPVKLGAVTDFGNALLSLTSQITKQVQSTSQGSAPEAPTPSPAKRVSAESDTLAGVQEKVAKLGNALQMRYLQNAKGEAPPTVFNAWLVDKDIHHPEQSSIDVRVLVTRDQLSDLRNGLQQVLELAEEGVLSPANFLNELKSMAATLSRETGVTVKDGKGTNLADLGYMQEYMEDLPYTSEVMQLSLDDWQVWSPQQQLDFVHRLENKVAYYQALHDHTDLWVAPAGGAINGDSVFPVPLELLP